MAVTCTWASMGSPIGITMKGTRNDWNTCIAGKTTAASSSPVSTHLMREAIRGHQRRSVAI